MSGSDDSQNNFNEPHAESYLGTSRERTPSDPGTSRSHGMPKAVTRSRKKMNSDEEDSNFVPEVPAPDKQKEKAAVRKVVRKEYTKASELKTRDEQMSFLVSTIQGMEKNISEILLKHKSLERIVETKFHDLDVKVTELTTTIQQLQHEVDSVKIPCLDDDAGDDDDDSLFVLPHGS
ncbi:nucleolysin tiar [Hordeum vulgare]|nr:nucleolysin tiar [Hordeum vulgare]